MRIVSKAPHSLLPTPSETTGAEISGGKDKDGDDDADADADAAAAFVCLRGPLDTPSCRLFQSRRVMTEGAANLSCSQLRHHT